MPWMRGGAGELSLAAQRRRIYAGPAAEFGVRLIAVVVGAFAGNKGAGLQGLPDGGLLGCDTGPAKNAVGAVGKAVVGEWRAVAGTTG